MKTSTWEHDALAADLAASIQSENRMVWTDMQLGGMHSPRPDVYTINKSYSKPSPAVYECKISVSDFRADITVGKWHTYLNYAHSVTFAAPVGLISKADVPEMCGLIVRHENAWRWAKRATVNPRPISQDALLKLLIDGVSREGPRIRAKAWRDEYPTRKFSKRFGAEAARFVGDAADTHRRIEYAEFQVREMLKRANEDAAAIRKRAEDLAPKAWAELLEVLGLKAGAAKWEVDAVIRELRTDREGGKEALALKQTLGVLQRLVDNNKEFVAEVAR